MTGIRIDSISIDSISSAFIWHYTHQPPTATALYTVLVLTDSISIDSLSSAFTDIACMCWQHDISVVTAIDVTALRTNYSA